MRKAGDVLKEDTETAAFVGDAISNAVNNSNPMLNQFEINFNRQETDSDVTDELKAKQLYELTSAQLPFS
ncbi:hypothetical protein N9Z90_02450 [Synechococcus sp. AH-707-D15]|nr:hypothetical protein [Synechococcus sp. AH-707-D15]